MEGDLLTAVNYYALEHGRGATQCPQSLSTMPGAKALGTELARRLPNLIYSVVDRFPLAGGVAGDHISVIAVRAVPVHERMDVEIATNLQCTVQNRTLVQNEQRLLTIPFPQDGTGHQREVCVCWHDITDYIALLLRANPSCVEALATEESPLYTTPEWTALREACNREHCKLLLASRTYRCACVGPAISLLQGKKKAKQGKDNEELLDPQKKATILELCRRAVAGALDDDLHARLEELAKHPDARKSEWLALTYDIMQAAKALPGTISGLPVQAVEAWVDEIREKDFSSYVRQRLASTPPAPPLSAGSALEGDWSERLAGVWPPGAELIFMAQSGSFMYDVHMPSSDCDYTIVFMSRPDQLSQRLLPASEFQHHVHGSFAADKTGEVEYSGKELGNFLVELSKGNPRNVELLFTSKPHTSSSVWQELCAMRDGFLTIRCARQYLGFITDRLRKAAPECEMSAQDFDEVCSKRFSKCLYHAYHKMFELTRVLRGERPVVALTGQEREFVMELRVRPPSTLADAQARLVEANKKYDELGKTFDDVIHAGTLPQEVDADLLIEWLRSVRDREAAKLMLNSTSPAIGSALSSPAALRRTRSSGDNEAITAMLAEIEEAEGIHIVHAGYAASSRTLGTTHQGSDHDVKFIFVLRRSAYFGIKPVVPTFSRSFPAAAGMAQVDINGWEARHACKLVRNGNPAVLSVLHSPVEFRTSRWAAALREAVDEVSDLRKLALAWRKHGEENFQSYIEKKDAPIRKKYVHVLRPLLCLAWLRCSIEKNGGRLAGDWPPALLLDLASEVAEAGMISAAEMELVTTLVTKSEDLSRALPHVPDLDTFIRRLINSEDGNLPFNNAGSLQAAAGDATLHELCAAMIEDMSSY